MLTEPGAPKGPNLSRAGDLGGEASLIRLPAPFLLSPEFAHHDSRPTKHEWLSVKRVERGCVAPFVHNSTDTQEAERNHG